MRTRQDRLLDLIGQADTQYVIPIYQRVYSWTDRQCAELWADLMDAGAKGRMHFAGTFLCIPEPNNGNGIKQYSIVDGQQRMATTTLLLAALADYLRETGTEPEGVPAHSDISARYLHCDGAAQGGLKLLLSRGDKPALAAVIAGEAPPEGATERVGDNFRFFRGKMAEDGFDAAQLWRGLANLTVIDAELDGGDHAQLIFESLNSKGVPLVEVDLIRNYLLLTKSHAEQQRLYDEYWKPIEDMFAPDPGSLKLNNGIKGGLPFVSPPFAKRAPARCTTCSSATPATSSTATPRTCSMSCATSASCGPRTTSTTA